MWDFNAAATITVSERLEVLVDAGLQMQREAQPPRQYLGASRLGASCERQLQYEYAGAPVDPGRGFSGRLLRIFERGHRMEEAMAGWLRMAGFGLETERHDGQQFGFSALDGRLQGHVDGVLSAGPDWLSYPALWESKCLGASPWRQLAKSGLAVARPTYAAQVALIRPIWCCTPIQRCSPRSMPTPWNSMPRRCRSMPCWHSGCRIARCASSLPPRPGSCCRAALRRRPIWTVASAPMPRVAGEVRHEHADDTHLSPCRALVSTQAPRRPAAPGDGAQPPHGDVMPGVTLGGGGDRPAPSMTVCHRSMPANAARHGALCWVRAWCPGATWSALEPECVRRIAHQAGYLADEQAHWQALDQAGPAASTAPRA